jgi:S1-C subfamily serine protease
MSGESRMTSRNAIVLVLVSFTGVSLAGCAAPTPIKMGNMTFPSREVAITTMQRQANVEVARIGPMAQRLGGTLLVVLPTIDDSRAYFEQGAAQLAPDYKETYAEFTDLFLSTDARAIENAKIFDVVRSLRRSDPASQTAQGYDYKLVIARPPAGPFKLTLSKQNAGERELVLGLAKPSDFPAWNVVNVALLNAAADLGAPVTRQPLPVAALMPGGAGTAPGNWTGTSFLINADGFALSNAHVVEGCKSLKMALGDGTSAEVTTVAVDRQNDLALIKVPPISAAHATFSAGPLVRQGEDVVVFGYPMAGTLASQGNLSTGIVSALAGLKDDSRLLQITAPVQPGNSGGPLFDTSGNVIGVVNSKINALTVAKATGDIPQNINFAIKANIATNFLETNGAKYDRAPPRKGLNTADISDRAKGFTHMLTCQR